MTEYEITVNGKTYDVTVQKKKANAAPSEGAPKATQPVVAPATKAPISAPAVQTNSTIGIVGKKVVAPMPGKIIAIHITVGSRVTKGQELIIMEAMKMHNPILAASEGTISEIFVKINDSVQSGQALVAIK